MERFVQKVHLVTHQMCDQEDTKALEALAVLLDFETSDIPGRLVPRAVLQKCCDALKYMGAYGPDALPLQRPLSLLGGWLLAAAAFRQERPAEDWAKVFEVKDVEVLDEDKARAPLVPPQAQQTLEATLRDFYKLCSLLFASTAEGTKLHAKVTISPNDGLALFLKPFRCMVKTKDKSLYCRIAECCRASLEGKEMPNNETSRAIWRVLLRSYLADHPSYGGEAGIFGSVCRINIFPSDGDATKVVFR
jgi:hypothetical protein